MQTPVTDLLPVPWSSSSKSMCFFCGDMMKAAREQSCTWWAPSAAQDKKKKRALRVRRQREDGSGLGNLPDGLAE